MNIYISLKKVVKIECNKSIQGLKKLLRSSCLKRMFRFSMNCAMLERG
jgi:hypothetical protein